MSDEGMNEVLFFPEALRKLKERLSCDDLNFFDPSCDFTVEASSVNILDKLAEGSYGVVYKASIGGEMFAVKVEDLKTGVEEQLNILSELTMLQSLPHDALVKYFGAGYLSKSSSEAKVLIVMELCERGALRERIGDGLSWPLIVRLALDVATGLNFLHQQHFVHRDVKTTNILIDKEWRAKLCDFSFSCHTSSQVKHDFIYGTDEFMSPEISLCEEFDESADIFSFGIVLCEMITRREPSGTFLKRYAHKGCFALPEAELREAVILDCPESLEMLAIQCCDVDPLARPCAQQCVEWLSSLLDELGGMDYENSCDVPVAPSSAVAGVSPVREGTVIYPKNRDRSNTRHVASRPSFERGSSASLTMSDVMARLSYLEIQVQELRAENKHLTRELLRLTDRQSGTLNEPPQTYSRSSSFNCSPQTPRNHTTPRASPSGKDVHSATRTGESGITAPKLSDVLSQIDELKVSMLRLSADVVSIRGKGPPKLDFNHPASSVTGVALQSPTSYIEDAAQSPFMDKPPRRHSPVSYGTSRGASLTSPRVIRGGQTGNIDTGSPSSPSFDSVVQSFLEVVGKCSEVTSKSQETLDLIDRRTRNYVDADCIIESFDTQKEKSPIAYTDRDNLKGSPGFISHLSAPKNLVQHPDAKVATSVLSTPSNGHKQKGRPGVSMSTDAKYGETPDYDNHSAELTPPGASETWRVVLSRSPNPMKQTSICHKQLSEVAINGSTMMSGKDVQKRVSRGSPGKMASHKPDLSRKKDMPRAIKITETVLEEQQRERAVKQFFQPDNGYDSIFKKDSYHASRSPKPQGGHRGEGNTSRFHNRPVPLRSQLRVQE